MSRRDRIALFVIATLALGVFLRLHDFRRTPGLWIDEAFNGTDALHALRTGHFESFYPSNFGREGLFLNLQAAAIWLFRDRFRWSDWSEPWMLRSVSAVFGCLTLGAFYGFSRRLLGSREAALALFFLATSSWHIIFSRIGFRAISAPFFLCLGLFLALRAAATSRGAGLLYAFLAGATFGAGFQTYLAFRPMPAIAIAILLAEPRGETLRRRFQRVGLFLVAFGAAAYPLLKYYLGHPADFMGRANLVAVWGSGNSTIRETLWSLLKTAQMCFVFGDFNWRHNVSKSPELSLVAGCCLIWGVLRLSAETRRRGFRRRRALLILGLLAATALPVALSREMVPHALRSIQMLVPVMLISAVGGLSAYRFLVRRCGVVAARALAALLLAISCGSESYKYFHSWLRAPELGDAFTVPAAEAGYRLRDLPVSTPKFVLTSGDPEILARPAMFLSDTADADRRAALHVVYTSDPNAAKAVPNAIVLDIRSEIDKHPPR